MLKSTHGQYVLALNPTVRGASEEATVARVVLLCDMLHSDSRLSLDKKEPCPSKNRERRSIIK